MPRPAAARAGDASSTPSGVRQRIVFCECVDCSEGINEPITVTDEAMAAAERVARQLPPPKAIVLLGSGLVHSSLQGSSTLDECTLPHLNAIAREGCLGVLANRKQAGGLRAGIHDVSQWCGVYEEFNLSTANQGVGKPSIPTLASSHQGIKVVAASHPSPAQDLLRSLGAVLPPSLQLQPQDSTQTSGQPQAGPGVPVDGWPGQEYGLPQPVEYASSLVDELGVSEGTSGADLFLLHLDADALQHVNQGNEVADAVHDSACAGLQWLDGVVSGLMKHQEVKQQVLLTLVLTQHAGTGSTDTGTISVSAADMVKQGVAVQQASALLRPGQMLDPNVHVVTPRDMAALTRMGGMRGLNMLDDDGLEAVPLVPRPKQSWQVRGLQDVDVDMANPGLCARRLPGVIRRDRSEKISLQEAVSKGAMGAMLIDRLLPELAYKLGRAPKYGA